MQLRLKNVSISFPNWKMDNFSMEAKSGSITSIVGPSGCGKTTVLRIISGLQEITAGKVFFGEKDMTDILPEQRNVGVVFQSDSLFSHLNVFENVAFGLKMKKEKNIRKKVISALKLVQMTGFEKRNTTTLSGGEQKRVAIARAIAFEPDLLLLDEPLNGLDAKLIEKTKIFLKNLQEKTGLTMLFVTHDIDEAFFLSDKIIVMNNGKIEQYGNPKAIFLRPINRFVKEFISDYILIKAKVKTKGNKSIIYGKFSFLAKKAKGKQFINLKKTNYKFFE